MGSNCPRAYGGGRRRMSLLAEHVLTHEVDSGGDEGDGVLRVDAPEHLLELPSTGEVHETDWYARLRPVAPHTDDRQHMALLCQAEAGRRGVASPWGLGCGLTEVFRFALGELSPVVRLVGAVW